MLGLEKSRFAKKLFGKYMKSKVGKYSGIHQKEIQGSIMLLDLESDPIFAKNLFFEGVHSYSVTSCCHNEIKSGMTIFDVGANIGYISFIAAKICDNNGHVIAFEPGVESLELMKKSLELNPYKNIEIINKAVAEKTKKGKLFLSPDANVDNKINDDGVEKRQYEDIEITSIDDFISMKNVVPDFVKIDVQGAEFLVFNGMEKLLQKKNPLKIVAEFSPRKHKEELTKLVNLLNKLKKLGFYAYYLKEPRKPIDVKSQSDYEKLVKKPITDFDNLGFSRYDEVDILFVR